MGEIVSLDGKLLRGDIKSREDSCSANQTVFLLRADQHDHLGGW